MRPVVHKRPRREVHAGSAAHPVVEPALHGALLLVGNLEARLFDLGPRSIDACEYPVGEEAALASSAPAKTRLDSPVDDGIRERRVGILDHDQPLLHPPSDG